MAGIEGEERVGSLFDLEDKEDPVEAGKNAISLVAAAGLGDEEKFSDDDGYYDDQFKQAVEQYEEKLSGKL